MTTGLNKYFNSSGSPSMTGTATLTIHVSDENDNSPTLGVNTIEMCQSGGASVANISVTDLDGDPYGGPFSFKVLGDVEGMWKVRPNQGRGLFLSTYFYDLDKGGGSFKFAATPLKLKNIIIPIRNCK